MHLQVSTFNSVIDLMASGDLIPLCEFAKNLEEAGEFERAAETLSGFWTGLFIRPETKGLHLEAKAELLLRTGTLTGWLGSAKQVSGAQEAAKDLISESAAIFERLNITEKVAEARVDLAICYLREGGLDEARVTLRLVLDSLGESRSEQRLRALLNSAIIEKEATRDQQALRICSDAAPLFEVSSNDLTDERCDLRRGGDAAATQCGFFQLSGELGDGCLPVYWSSRERSREDRVEGRELARDVGERWDRLF